MPSGVARTLLIGAMLLAAAACGYDTSATFNADGTVTVGMKFLLPKSLLQSGSGMSMPGLSPADIEKANTQLASKYPGAKIALVTEGSDAGAQVTIPFKTEKDAFAFLTEPSTLSPAGATSGSPSGINLANTGGLFTSATHTTSGQTDTYTFKSQPQPLPSPSPGSQELLPADELASIFTVTFSLSVPHEIQSAPGALFTLDRKTAIWKLSLTEAQMLTATTGSSGAVLAGFTSNNVTAQSMALLIGVGLAAIALGFILGKITPWLILRSQAVVPATAPAAATADFPPPASWLPAAHPPATGIQGPPPEMPPPPNPADTP